MSSRACYHALLKEIRPGPKRLRSWSWGSQDSNLHTITNQIVRLIMILASRQAILCWRRPHEVSLSIK